MKQQTFKHGQMTSNLNQQQMNCPSLLLPKKAVKEKDKILKVKKIRLP